MTTRGKDGRITSFTSTPNTERQALAALVGLLVAVAREVPDVATAIDAAVVTIAKESEVHGVIIRAFISNAVKQLERDGI